MRIAAVVHNGVKHDARALKGAASLKAQGHDVRLFGLTPDETEDFVLPNGVPVHLRHRDLTGIRDRMARENLERTRENSMWTSFRIQGDLLFEAVLDTFQPDTLHIHDHLALTAAGRYKEAFDCPIVWDAHEIYEDLANNDEARSFVNSKIIRNNAHHVDGFITLNESIAAYYKHAHPALPEAVLIPNAVERVSQSRYDGRLHEKAGLVPDQKILLFQGSFSEHRGIRSLLEASRHLADDWTLVFMGWGNLEADIRAHTEDQLERPAGRARVVVVPGAPHDELLQWTAGATLGTIPYEDAGLNHLYCSPNKLWEYPAAGVPILASDMPEMKRQIELHGIGITVGRALNPEVIAAVVNGLSGTDVETLRRNCGTYAAVENWQRYEPLLHRLHTSLAQRAGVVEAHSGVLSLWGRKLSSAGESVRQQFARLFGRG